MPRKAKLRRSRRIGFLLFIVGALLVPIGGALISIGWTERQNAIMAINGQLIPFNVDVSKPFDLMLSAGVIFQYNDTNLASGFKLNTIFPFNIMNLTDDQFEIRFINNRMLVSADIRDSNNTRIAQIVDNEWKTVNPDTLLFWDRNYNAYAFEIIGSNNVPTLQVIMVGPNKIQIGGLFHTRTGSIYIAPQLGGDAMLYINVGDEHREYGENISRIFYYPALTNPNNLGRMVNSVYLSSDPLSESTWTMVSGIIVTASGGILSTFGYEKYKTSKEEPVPRSVPRIGKERKASEDSKRRQSRK